jgi:hypothetical protein
MHACQRQGEHHYYEWREPGTAEHVQYVSDLGVVLSARHGCLLCRLYICTHVVTCEIVSDKRERIPAKSEGL